jgi:hypothetical protein
MLKCGDDMTEGQATVMLKCGDDMTEGQANGYVEM